MDAVLKGAELLFGLLAIVVIIVVAAVIIWFIGMGLLWLWVIFDWLATTFAFMVPPAFK